MPSITPRLSNIGVILGSAITIVPASPFFITRPVTQHAILRPLNEIATP